MFPDFLPPAPLEQTSLRNSLLPDNLSPQTDLHKRLRESERRTSFLLANKKYIQANALLESIQYQLNEYYKAGPAVSKNMQTMRTLSKFKKREELTLMHNQAVVMNASNNLERATDILTVIIEEANHMIQSEQTRYGFLQQSDQSQRKAALENITFWKHFLIRYYYFLALLTFQNAAHEISLASLMKGLDLVKEIYRNQRQSSSKFIDTLHDQTYTEKLCQLQQAEELYLLCELRERVGHSKYLNIVSMNALVEMASALLQPTKSRKENPASFEFFQFGKMLELELPSIEVILFNSFIPKQATPLDFSKIALLIYQNLLSKIYAEHSKLLQNQYQKLKNAKNIILLHILIGIICHKYIPYCQKVQEILLQYRQMYKTKCRRQVANIYSLIELFGLSPSQLSDNNHVCEDLSILQVHRTEEHKKKTNIKKVKSTQKHPTKSKSKQKKSPAPSSKQKNKNPVQKIIDAERIKQRQKKHRIKEEYMLKRQGHKPTKGRDHLLKAIHQNYRSFDSSLSKEKPKSPDQRAIKTETNIDHKPRQKVEKVKRR